MKKFIKIVLCGMVFLVLGCGNTSEVYLEGTEDVMIQQTEQVISTEITRDVPAAECYVYVCGAVHAPGVYALPAGSRIFEAVEMAGGMQESACAESINQAETVTDGQMIKILTYAELEEKETEAAETAESDGKVNINRAGVDELMTLPGIGESKANSILSYRDAHGAFTSIEELMNITGIKEGVYSKIKEYITVD